jgi:GAF domain-containing protein
MGEVRDLLVGLAGTLDMLSNDTDLPTALTRVCDAARHLLPVDGAAICLLDEQRRLRLSVASDEIISRIEILEHGLAEGPCTDAATMGAPVMADDLGDSGSGRWPGFASAALLAGMRTVAGWPLGDRTNVVGSLCLFSREPFGFSDVQAGVAPLLAAFAGACVVDHQHRARDERTIEQLHYALSQQAVFEQAKGMLAVQLGTSVDQAFELLRRHARDHNLKAVEVARAIASGERILDDHDRRGRR